MVPYVVYVRGIRTRYVAVLHLLVARRCRGLTSCPNRKIRLIAKSRVRPFHELQQGTEVQRYEEARTILRFGEIAIPMCSSK